MEIIMPVFGKCLIGAKFFQNRGIKSALISCTCAWIGILLAYSLYECSVLKRKKNA